jgi:hypothetical protein
MNEFLNAMRNAMSWLDRAKNHAQSQGERSLVDAAEEVCSIATTISQQRSHAKELFEARLGVSRNAPLAQADIIELGEPDLTTNGNRS